jgi:uncharacterized protein YecE (DUF72 family)
LWQFPPTKKFEAEGFAAFLALLPATLDGHTLRHVVEVRHKSFVDAAFVSLLRNAGIAVVFSEHETYPAIADITANFVYLRLQKGEDSVPTAYPPTALDAWAERLRSFAAGGAPADLPCVEETPAAKKPRDVFAYVIHEGKIRAPAAAMALIERVKP